jgi:hypothetical protein
MAFRPSIRALIAALALNSSLGLASAHASEGGLNDWQPCPDSLAEESGEEPNKKWDLTISPYTHHWSHNPDHKPVALVALDRHLKGGRFCGLALFSNSFGQESAYIYVGQQWNELFGNPKLFTKLSAGFLYGYRDQYKDKIPYNKYGLAPVIIPSLGYAITPQDSAQVYLLGTAGLLFAYSRSF